MSDKISLDLVAALSGLAKVRAMVKRAEDASARIYHELDQQGFGRRAVDHALDLVNTNAQTGHAELLQAQRILELMRAPVQLELVSRIEAPVSHEQHLLAITDAGFNARFEGSSRIYRASSEEERAAWMRGYDEADQWAGA